MKIKEFKKIFDCIGDMSDLNIIIYDIDTCEVIKGYSNYWDFYNDSSNNKYKIFNINGIVLFKNSIDIWVK